ncbi:DUF892 family protein [Flavobacterium coralii]|uniref:YciE/YciF ferroxidase family protein n=1 Tax=Flavobacterium coralii TaxID=2838017 RepID=UPI000C5BBFE1|nr:hypothetical protein [Flavobacterium sp.]|tara:strand:+ start:26200 stop:26730 length:531 start_codon:yes stop_codon:yes gene_type:complete
MIINVAKENSGEATELRALFEKQLKEIYWAETVMVNVISDCVANIKSADLVSAMQLQSLQAMKHSDRLEEIFRVIGIAPETKRYEALDCLIKEGEELLIATKRGVVRDAGIISVMQKIKHYEIACYGTMRAHALALREEDAVTLLERTLEEEKQADLTLSKIAESHINTEAADKEI